LKDRIFLKKWIYSRKYAKIKVIPSVKTMALTLLLKRWYYAHIFHMLDTNNLAKMPRGYNCLIETEKRLRGITGDKKLLGDIFTNNLIKIQEFL
jgi:hypothetical protein